jgi:hypothetical protein
MVPAQPALAGAWARERGEAYAKASVAFLNADEMFDAVGSVQPLFEPSAYSDPLYRESSVSLYVEYGLTAWLTCIGSVPVKQAVQSADGIGSAGDIYGRSFGVGDVHLGTRVPIHRGKWVAALESDVKIPLYDLPDAGTLDPPLGSDMADLGASLSLGVGLPPVRGYGQGSLGYRIRGGHTAEEIYWDVEIGAEPASAVRLRFRFDGVDSEGTKSFTPSSPMEAPVPAAGEQDYNRIAPTIAIVLGEGNELSVTWRRVVAGRATIRSSEWEIAYSFLGPFLPGATSGL